MRRNVITGVAIIFALAFIAGTTFWFSLPVPLLIKVIIFALAFGAGNVGVAGKA